MDSERKKELTLNEKLILSFLYDWMRPIRPGDLKEHLEAKHSTLNFQLKSLQNEGFVKWDPYKPVSLTEKGKEIASHHRRHAAILETFLMKMLLIDEEIVHDESKILGPLMSCRLVKAISAFLENPQRSPCKYCGAIPPEKVCLAEE